MTDRTKPGVAFWATVVVVVVLAYAISFGPACWITSRTSRGAATVSIIYRPMTHCMNEDRAFGFGGINVFMSDGFLSKFASLFAADGWNWRLIRSLENPDAHWQWGGPTL